MDNTFISQLFDWSAGGDRGTGLWLVNNVLRRIGIPLGVRRSSIKDMTNLEQRINLWHLACQPLAYGVEGDLVELGCFNGKTAVIFARAVEDYAPERRLHLYDNFKSEFHFKGVDIQEEVLRNFRSAGSPAPVLHAGNFEETIPDQLPEKIAFAHIDCGTGGDIETHKKMVLYLLENIYPRMSPGAICALMDYFDPKSRNGADYNPGVGLAVREFFADKPEECCALWASECSQGFFRKQ